MAAAVCSPRSSFRSVRTTLGALARQQMSGSATETLQAALDTGGGSGYEGDLALDSHFSASVTTRR